MPWIALRRWQLSLTSSRSKRSHELRGSHARRSMPSCTPGPSARSWVQLSSAPTRQSAPESRHVVQFARRWRACPRQPASSATTHGRPLQSGAPAFRVWPRRLFTGSLSPRCSGSHRAPLKRPPSNEPSHVSSSWRFQDPEEVAEVAACAIRCRHALRKRHRDSGGLDRLRMRHRRRCSPQLGSLKYDARRLRFQLPLRLQSLRTRFRRDDSWHQSHQRRPVSSTTG